MSRKKKKGAWIKLEDIQREIDDVLTQLQKDTHGSTPLGKARAATIASTYLFEFWKRAKTPNMTLDKAQRGAVEAMHRTLELTARKEAVEGLEKDLREVSNVQLVPEAQGEERVPSDDGEVPQVAHGAVYEGTPDSALADTPQHEGPEVVDHGAQGRESEASSKAESIPAAIREAAGDLARALGTADEPRQMGGQEGGHGGAEAEGPPSGESRKGWKETTAKGRKVAGDKVLSVRSNLPAAEGRGHQVLSNVRGDSVPVGALTEEDMKNFREMNPDELAEKINQVLRSKADAMEKLDGENIKEVKNTRPGKGSLGTANMSVAVGRKICTNCRFELPGYETVCVACKAPQPLVQKP